MSSADAFLACIRENPDDDAVRLVFADWLEEHGDPDRAEFIRLQVRLAQMPDHHPERFDLEERSRDLLAEHHARWLAHLPKWAKAVELTFRRGLPEAAKLTAAAWLRHGERLAQLVPLQRLHLDSCDRLAEVGRLISSLGLNELECPLPHDRREATTFFVGLREARLRRLYVFSARETRLVASLLAWPGLGRLTGLGISSFSDESRFLVLASPHLGPLERLSLSLRLEKPAVWSALAANDRLAGLRHLELWNTDNPGHGMGRALAGAPWSRLEHFRLDAGRINRDDLRELLAARWASGIRSFETHLGDDPGDASRTLWQARLPQLEGLTLYAPTAPPWLADFSASDLAPGLASLTLYKSWNDPETAALSKAPFRRLHRLHLKGRMDAADACALVDSARLGVLKEFHLSCGGDPGIGAALACCAGLSRLRALTLQNNPQYEESYAALASSPNVGALARLNLSHCGVTDSQLAVLLDAAWLPAVRELNLSSNQITDRGAEALAACPALSRLRLLDLRDNPLSRVGGAALAGSPHLNRLSRLVLPTGRIDAKTQDRLRERFGIALVLGY